MKRILLAALLATAAGAPAMAADLAARYPVKAVVAPVVPVFSWTGFYVGGNLGYGGGTNDYAFGTPLTSVTGSANAGGFVGGGQIGYNYQFANNVVLGLETDIQWTGIENNVSAASLNVSTSLDYFGTVRARLGYAIDRFLPYVTGGLAYGKTKTSANLAYITNDIFSGSSTNTGWTVGGGVEYAVTGNWTFKTEYLYVDLGSNDYTSLTTTDAMSVDNAYHVVRAGLNYKF
ncbi:outer-membrane immunogenic protein [Azorhizobium oxalatiphilum]|uniref:Outer-membrane immunogenic protein n=1 Tax=Azorhizobium oxalatiphilum TaxID=980631 RepID=A0A917BRQ8_9HYPH|nr:outer membrane protein [Azorhizobium oxalatiphilum]GGF56250.1 outer-membrane immunogenic protein [Azorhizobium oxalatiphilum]